QFYCAATRSDTRPTFCFSHSCCIFAHSRISYNILINAYLFEYAISILFGPSSNTPSTVGFLVMSDAGGKTVHCTCIPSRFLCICNGYLISIDCLSGTFILNLRNTSWNGSTLVYRDGFTLLMSVANPLWHVPSCIMISSSPGCRF